MNCQASNPESLSETPERLSETKTRSDSAAKKRAAEVLTSCTNLTARSCMTSCGETVKFHPVQTPPLPQVIPFSGNPGPPMVRSDALPLNCTRAVKGGAGGVPGKGET